VAVVSPTEAALEPAAHADVAAHLLRWLPSMATLSSNWSGCWQRRGRQRQATDQAAIAQQAAAADQATIAQQQAAAATEPEDLDELQEMVRRVAREEVNAAFGARLGRPTLYGAKRPPPNNLKLTIRRLPPTLTIPRRTLAIKPSILTIRWTPGGRRTTTKLAIRWRTTAIKPSILTIRWTPGGRRTTRPPAGARAHLATSGAKSGVKGPSWQGLHPYPNLFFRYRSRIWISVLLSDRGRISGGHSYKKGPNSNRLP
jgi:hypothetical protein